MAVYIYGWTLALVFFSLLGVALMDLGLYLDGQESISDWLRSNPMWFWWPIVISMIMVGLLALHLFVEPAIWKWFRS